MAPKGIGKDYLVLGTIEKKIWQQGLGSSGTPIAEMFKHVADFKHQYVLQYKLALPPCRSKTKTRVSEGTMQTHRPS
jgi:hypothetical protein